MYTYIESACINILYTFPIDAMLIEKGLLLTPSMNRYPSTVFYTSFSSPDWQMAGDIHSNSWGSHRDTHGANHAGKGLTKEKISES